MTGCESMDKDFTPSRRLFLRTDVQAVSVQTVSLSCARAIERGAAVCGGERAQGGVLDITRSLVRLNIESPQRHNA